MKNTISAAGPNPQKNAFSSTPEEQAVCSPAATEFYTNAVPDAIRVMACLQDIAKNCERAAKKRWPTAVKAHPITPTFEYSEQSDRSLRFSIFCVCETTTSSCGRPLLPPLDDHR